MREGLIPTILGTAVTATGAAAALRTNYSTIGWSVAAFGLAHVVLGAIDLIEHRNEFRF
jgi:hypothetical protein